MVAKDERHSLVTDRDHVRRFTQNLLSLLDSPLDKSGDLS